MFGDLHQRADSDADPTPLLITQAPRPGIDALEWTSRHQDEVRAALLRHGAILLRGFALEGASAFTALAKHISPVLHNEYRDLPPENSDAGVYRTTDYPEQHAIHVHNEGAHAAAPPLYLFFLNQEAPAEGGATRLADTRRVLAAIDPTLRNKLRAVGLTYVRTHHPRVDLSWQALYGTDDPREAERRCRDAGLGFRWLRRDTLQTSVTMPALTTHPLTGEEVPFHQLFLFHPACLDAETRAGLDAIYTPDELPRTVRWGSGEPIDDATVRDLFALYEKHTFEVRWQPGDALIIDNALVAHGREPFVGRRKLLVAMGGAVHNQPRPVASVSRRRADPSAPLARVDYDPVPLVFRAVALHTPQATAIESEDRQWTYCDLECRAVQTAAALSELNLARGAAVGITGPRSFEVVAAMLGVWMNGQVVVPIDAELPAARKQLMLAEADARVLLFAGEGPAWFAGPKIDLTAPLARAAPDFTPVTLRPDDPAYVFFTSGSTGRPKGITGTHVGLAHFLDWQRTTFGIASGDRIAQLTSLSFDVVLRDLFLALTSGAVVCLPPPSFNLADPWAWFRRARITRLHAVPSLASVWLSESAQPWCDTLATVFFAGEPLSDVLVRRMRAATGAEIVNLYGPTETTLAKCALRIGEKVEKGVQPIGYPLPGVMVLIVDERGAQCEPGETGEIVIRTPYRTLGYLRDEDGAGSRFARNPFGAEDGDIVYYTGDLGRVRADDAIDILGRKDDQVKVMGVRIEPQEVSAALISHPHVRQAFVTARTGGASLIAYVVADENLAAAAMLRAFLAERLPAALVPQRFVHLPALPLNASGKIDRKALPQPEADGGSSLPLPAVRTEPRLAAIFADLLHLDQVNPSDDFFDSGGHSLLAMQLVSRVRSTFGVAFEIQHVFEFPTLAALSHCIAELSPIAPGDAGVAAAAIDRSSPQPLSFAQQRLWFFAKLVPEQGVYNIPGALRFRGGADIELLQRCIDALVVRHPSLRTRFLEKDGRAQQCVAPVAEWFIERRDVSTLPPDGRGAVVREIARALRRQPFALDSAPLARGALVRESAHDDVFVYALHHAIADGWSNFVFSRELVQVYAAGLTGAPASLPALPVDTLDFARDERERFADVGQREIDYWTAHLRGAPARLDLPADRPRPPVQTFNGASAVRTLPATLAHALHQSPGEPNTTLFMKMFAGFNILLHELSSARDLVIGIPVARRTGRELESVIGCLINTLALRTRIDEKATFATVLAAVRSAVLGAFAHQDAPFDRVVEALAPPRDPGRHPVFQVLFNYLHFDEPGMVHGDLAIEREVVVDPETKFDMTLYVRERRERIEVRLVYNADLFDADRIERLLERYEGVLKTCLSEPLRPLDEWVAPVPPFEKGGAGGISRALHSSKSPLVPLFQRGRPEPLETPPSQPAPATPQTLTAMLELWREALRLDRLDAEDDFFALGGHSLLAAQLVARAADRFGVDVPLRTVFAHPTAAALAAWVDGAMASGGGPVLPPIESTPRHNRELSLDQERFWQLHRAGADGHYYNVPRAVRLSGRLDLDALRAALRAVVRHHDALRTIFEDGDDGPRARVCDDEDLELELLDSADAAAAIEREARHEFDLAKRLPLRAALVRHDRDESTLIVTAHHIAADCWSLGLPFQAVESADEAWYPGIFFADLMAVYDACSRRQPFPLPPSSITFADFASWQKARLRAGDFAAHAAFWRDHLDGAPRALDLPADFPRPAKHTQSGARREFTLPADLAARLDRFRRKHRTTLFVPLLAAFGLAIKEWSGHDDLVVGTPVANRAQSQVRNLVGPVGNTVALRVRLDDDPAPAALVGRLREVVPRAFAHQEYPFAQLVGDLGAAGVSPPLFQIRFVLQQAPELAPHSQHVAMTPIKIDRGVSKYDLSLVVAAQGARLRGWCEYNTDLFKSETIAALAERYVSTLRAMVSASDHDG